MLAPRCDTSYRVDAKYELRRTAAAPDGRPSAVRRVSGDAGRDGLDAVERHAEDGAAGRREVRGPRSELPAERPHHRRADSLACQSRHKGRQESEPRGCRKQRPRETKDERVDYHGGQREEERRMTDRMSE